MGLFSSSSKSSNTQNNITNNTSQNYALNASGDGTTIWGEGNTLIQTDHRAVRDALDFASSMASDFMTGGRDALFAQSDALQSMSADNSQNFGRLLDSSETMIARSLSAADNTNARMQDTAYSAMIETGRIASDAMTQNNALARDALGMSYQFGDLARDSIGAQNSLAESSLSMAGDFGMLASTMAREAMQNSTDLAGDFAAELRGAQSQTMDAMINQTKYALQFADNASRSDGQQFAVEAGKNNMYTMLGVAALMGLALFMKGR